MEKYHAEPCKQCKTKILKTKHRKIFCNRSCAASFNNKGKERNSTKISKSLSNRCQEIYNSNPRQCRICSSVFSYEKRKRIVCDTCINTRSKRTSHLLCKCGNNKKNIQKYCGSCKTNISHYRSLCSFNFNVYEYPEEFDLSLIEKHGWYSPNGYGKRNKTPNLNGVSRDHLYSVSSGFNLNKDSKIISHPANCSIMLHNGPRGNNSKNSNSSITWEDLLDRIELWEKKYGGPPKT